MKVEIIADIGSNHRGSLELALKAIEAAKSVGADVVKFQCYTHRELYGLDGEAPHATPREWLAPLADCAAKVGIEFACTAFSPEGVIAVDPFVERHKVASSEMLHWQILNAVESAGKPVLISTGGHNQGDVQWLIGKVLHFRERITLLECAASYPAAIHQHDLRLLPHWSRLGFGVGLSDHSTSEDHLAVAAVGAGARVIEKHFDPFDGEPATPDTPVSLSNADMRRFTESVRFAELAMGEGVKNRRNQPEMALRWRRRLIATKFIEAGEKLELDQNFGLYRSLHNDTRGAPCWLAAEHTKGKVAIRNLHPGEPIAPNDFI